MRKLWIAACLLLTGCSNAYAFNLNRQDRAEVAQEERIYFKIGIAQEAQRELTLNGVGWIGVNQYLNRHPSARLQHGTANLETDADRERVVRELIDIRSDIVLGFGGGFKLVFEQLQHEYPETKFVLLGGEILEREPNLVSVTFEDQQSAFLAGVAAATTSETGQIAFLGGAEVEEVLRQRLAFEGGILYANAHYYTDAELAATSYAGTFFDMKLGRKIAKDIYRQGVDVLFASAGATGVGAIDTAKVLVEQGRKLWYIGVDHDLYEAGELVDGRCVTLTSVMKRLDMVIYELLEAYVHGYFPGGEHLVKGIQNHGVGLADHRKNFNEETVLVVEQLQQAIMEGRLVIPYDLEDLAAFVKAQKQSRL